MPAYLRDWAFVRPMTLCRAAALAFTYPVDPTTMAVTCSVSDPFFTVRVCAPDGGAGVAVDVDGDARLRGDGGEVDALAADRLEDGLVLGLGARALAAPAVPGPAASTASAASAVPPTATAAALRRMRWGAWSA